MSRDDFKRVSKPHYTQYVGTSHEAPGAAMGGLRGLRIGNIRSVRSVASVVNALTVVSDLYQVAIVLCSPWGKIKLAINCHLWD